MTLADKIEALEGPSCEVDAEIARSLGWSAITYGGKPTVMMVGEHPDGGRRMVPKYTARLDDAMSLVPEGMMWEIGDYRNETSADLPSGVFARVSNYAAGDGPRWENDDRAEAATPALALCVAALRARQQ